MQRIVLSLMLVAILLGCTPGIAYVPTQTPSQRSIDIFTPTSIVSLLTKEQDNGAFTEVNISHQDKNGFSENTTFQLLVKMQEGKIGILNISSGEIESELELPDSDIDDPVVNQDGSLIAYIYGLPDQKYLGIKKPASKNEDFSIQLPKEAVIAKWLSKSKLAVWGGSPEWECKHLLLIFDSSTTHANYPKYSAPDLPQSDCLKLPLVTTDETELIYPWQVFDLESGVSTNGFPFMKDFPRTPPAYALKEFNEEVSIAYAAEDKLNYVLSVPTVDISKEEIEPKTILLPGLATKDHWWQSLIWWQEDQMKLGIDLIDEKIDPLELLVSGQYPPTRFYVVDFNTRQILNYDLDRGVFTEDSLPQKIYDGFPSPDGRYFAWTIYDSLSNLPIGSKVLELSSGFVTSSPQFEILGWIMPITK
jgi:hypothetical protein